MSTLEAKPRKVRILNARMLSLAALALVVLALLFQAAPLIRTAGLRRSANFGAAGNGQALPQGQSGGTQLFVGGGAGQLQGGTNTSARRVLVGGGFSRVTILIYFVMLLISLAAAIGMLFTKRWAQVLGIIMAVLYGLMGLLSLVPMLLGFVVPVTLILGIVHLLLAVAVIVLASIPGKPASVAAPAPAADPSGV